jgi:hypothetical protein
LLRLAKKKATCGQKNVLAKMPINSMVDRSAGYSAANRTAAKNGKVDTRIKKQMRTSGFVAGTGGVKLLMAQNLGFRIQDSVPAQTPAAMWR